MSPAFELASERAKLALDAQCLLASLQRTPEMRAEAQRLRVIVVGFALVKSAKPWRLYEVTPTGGIDPADPSDLGAFFGSAT